MINEDFYNEFSQDYDIMTGFLNRFQKEELFFKKLIENNKIQTCLDIGCGTGFHSLLLENLGMTVTGLDPSEKMIEKAIDHRNEIGGNVQFIATHLSDYYFSVKNKFDAVFCMGNTLPHITERDEIMEFFKQIKILLRENGVFIIQIVNYDKILLEKKRILNIKEEGRKIFIRFYDFDDKIITFNILTLEKNDINFENKLISTNLYPYRSEEIKEIALANNYIISKILGNIQLKEYNPQTSDNFIVILNK